MSGILKNVLLFCVCLTFALTSCTKKEFDEFYARPDNLADPIYQQLSSRGNFTSLLKCIDKAGYKESLSGGGYWTFFAADDAAFTKYLSSIGKNSADDIDNDLARKIVTYNLVYNSYSDEDLIKYQSPGQSTAQVKDYAIKRKTAYYDFVYPTQVTKSNGQTVEMKVVNTNRNGNLYVDADNNNKYIPYFTTASLAGLNLGVSDYKQFYPNTELDEFNVMGAKVVEKNIPAENGMIHIVDQVLTPLENLDAHIASNNQYSEFKKLLDMASTYTYNDALSKRYQALSKSLDSVYVKGYTGLAFSPNNENFLASGTDAQVQGYTMFVPTNAQLTEYTKEILKYYKTFSAAPAAILNDLINAHMWLSNVWPTKIDLEGNAIGETANFDKTAIVEKSIVSNGFFYGINSIQQPNAFRTVYGQAYLNPKYSLMKMALDLGLKPTVLVPTSKFTVFMMSDEEIRKNGYDYYSDKGNWGYLAPGTTGTPTVSDDSKQKIVRILETSVLPTPNGELNNLNEKGIVEAYNGEYVIYDNGKVYASGNVETNTPVTVDSSKTTVNGKVYYTKNLLTFTEKPILFTLQNLATADPSHFQSFYKLYNAYNDYYQQKPPVSLGSFYTFLVPDNNAIVQAVKDKVLPGNTTTGAPNFAPATSAEFDLLVEFIHYHILDKNSIASDGKKSGGFPTMLKNDDGDPLLLKAISPGKDNLSFQDAKGNIVPVSINYSNHLAFRTVIHSLPSYLKH